MTLKTICKFGERKKLTKKISKTIFNKQTQLKLSPTKMELCGGENMYRKGLLLIHLTESIEFVIPKKQSLQIFSLVPG